MNKIFVCSDFHFYHDRDFLYEPRGFLSVEEANEEMIRRYNEVVDDGDIVYILGDLGLNATGHEICELVARLNGRKYLALGNHDTDARIKAYKESELFEAVDYGFRLNYKKKTFWLTHYPTIVANYDDKPNYNIHGHTHDTKLPKRLRDNGGDYCKKLLCISAPSVRLAAASRTEDASRGFNVIELNKANGIYNNIVIKNFEMKKAIIEEKNSESFDLK